MSIIDAGITSDLLAIYWRVHAQVAPESTVDPHQQARIVTQQVMRARGIHLTRTALRRLENPRPAPVPTPKGLASKRTGG